MPAAELPRSALSTKEWGGEKDRWGKETMPREGREQSREEGESAAGKDTV